MQHEVGAFRSDRVRARYVLPGSQHRDPRGGTLRVFRALARVSHPARRTDHLTPVDAIRAAGRSAQLPTTVAAWSRAQRRIGRMSWAPARPSLRDPRSGSTPWRG
ncbi:MAG: hypothetical protein KF809_14305 [Chloroflexi bacterium]|nr:hypothetical protein [Chloroflexota bacterium]